jgi:hypothetical protein
LVSGWSNYQLEAGLVVKLELEKELVGSRVLAEVKGFPVSMELAMPKNLVVVEEA